MTLVDKLRQLKVFGTERFFIKKDAHYRKPVVYGASKRRLTIGDIRREHRESPEQKEFWATTDYWRSL